MPPPPIGWLAHFLSPVLPPVVADVVAAPVIVLGALVEAMASSGQALVVPLLVGAAGFLAPGRRRSRDRLAEALGLEEPESID